MSTDRISKLLEFLETEPNDPFVLYALATEYNSRQETEKAFDYYLRLVRDHAGYVGTYYHLGKLYEKTGQTEQALEIYRKGMDEARKKRDMHALSELQGAYNSASGMDDDDDY
ncbi:tetratricopeptide repeat protein [Pedobacter yulinensis]|uniref:Tetratricopeptide repeat protein n=1 Tax=Pedobacter yulinensis TaxID=2126353 RepID=A0A2T3HKF3_9SPHI|nr:tetratricopeptide repeat protein [Pedobacter yulinensis]PST82938.1 tetratricopeptide repeat protein [Pedobacter yulinensis]